MAGSRSQSRNPTTISHSYGRDAPRPRPRGNYLRQVPVTLEAVVQFLATNEVVSLVGRRHPEGQLETWLVRRILL
ncbi:hypothetical protein GQ600_1472 [Phytophthora cactorum]|nr:hypothetical protein GQ600_1472 [Phytophthora cactorum]